MVALAVPSWEYVRLTHLVLSGPATLLHCVPTVHGLIPVPPTGTPSTVLGLLVTLRISPWPETIVTSSQGITIVRTQCEDGDYGTPWRECSFGGIWSTVQQPCASCQELFREPSSSPFNSVVYGGCGSCLPGFFHWHTLGSTRCFLRDLSLLFPFDHTFPDQLVNSWNDTTNSNHVYSDSPSVAPKLVESAIRFGGESLTPLRGDLTLPSQFSIIFSTSCILTSANNFTWIFRHGAMANGDGWGLAFRSNDTTVTIHAYVTTPTHHFDLVVDFPLLFEFFLLTLYVGSAEGKMQLRVNQGVVGEGEFSGVAEFQPLGVLSIGGGDNVYFGTGLFEVTDVHFVRELNLDDLERFESQTAAGCKLLQRRPADLIRCGKCLEPTLGPLVGNTPCKLSFDASLQLASEGEFMRSSSERPHRLQVTDLDQDRRMDAVFAQSSGGLWWISSVAWPSSY
eukprot:Lithocolla_globosa_v1_NODE_47_length_7891_cov_8.351582.p3 type:complete len:452 gc:universal NODE_47_length_7891_cov_8.351582:2250-3605(+)